MSTDVLMMLAAAINIFVINAVKFFFEVLIWLTPVPFLDAAFEVCNKTLCAALMAVYAWSPAVATALNLAMFAAAAIAFGWIHRRQVFFRTVLLDVVWGMFSSPQPRATVVVFPAKSVGPIKARACCNLIRNQSGWHLLHRPFLRSAICIAISDEQRPRDYSRNLTNTVTFAEPAVQLTFSRRYNVNLAELAIQLKATFPAGVDPETQQRPEFA